MFSDVKPYLDVSYYPVIMGFNILNGAAISWQRAKALSIERYFHLLFKYQSVNRASPCTKGETLSIDTMWIPYKTRWSAGAGKRGCLSLS